MDLNLPQVIGHRGAALAAPENTLESFREAAAQGARWVEFDVGLSADGQCFVLHDDTLDRTTSGKGPAHLKSVAELKMLDAGFWFGKAFEGAFGKFTQALESTVDGTLKQFADAQRRSRRNAAPLLFGENGGGDPQGRTFGDWLL